MSTRNEASGSGGQVVQSGTINGGVHFVNDRPSPQSNEIGVYLRPDRAAIRFHADSAEWFELTIANRTPRDRHLSLRFESAGATGLLWEHVDAGVPEVLTVHADRSLQLRLKVVCTSSALAGPDVLKVLAGELDARTGEHTWWSSDPLPIQIARAPGLHAVLRQPENVYAPGSYETVVTLSNTGNTPLEGWLYLRTELDGEEHPEWLGSGRVTFLDGPRYHLQPGVAVDVRVAVELPVSALADRAWRVPLAVHVDGDDPPVVTEQFTLTQRGDLAGLRDWGRTPAAWKRQTIVAGAAALFVLGILVGALPGGTPDTTAAPSPQSKTAASASSGAELPLTTMPCEEGKSVLVLLALEDTTTPADAKLFFDYEAMWARKHIPDGKLPDDAEVRLSERDGICPKVLQGPTPDKDTDEKYRRFVWVGPVPSDDAPALCRELYTDKGKSCSAVHVT